MQKIDLIECKKSDGKFILIFIVLFFAVGLMSHAPRQAPKTYTLTLPYNEWVKYSNGFQFLAEKLRQSDLPSKEVALITDSLLSPFLTHINTQIPRQIEAEKKADSSANKKSETPKKN